MAHALLACGGKPFTGTVCIVPFVSALAGTGTTCCEEPEWANRPTPSPSAVTASVSKLQLEFEVLVLVLQLVKSRNL